MSSDFPGEERSGEGLEQHDQWYERSEHLNHMTTDMLGKERSP